MLNLDDRTLAYFRASPMLSPMIVEADVRSIAGAIKKGGFNGGFQVHPEDQAVIFYLMNHLFSDLEHRYHKDEILPENILHGVGYRYLAELCQISRTLFYYTLLIITRESRHVKKSDDFMEELSKVCGKTYCSFLEPLSGSKGTVSRFINHPPKMTLIDYVSSVEWVFFNGTFSGGYGGMPWGNIAAALRRFVVGEISAETFVDTAWTLAHNNGPMFNKGMLYHHYSGELQVILDVQRSGQIPQYVKNNLNKNRCPLAKTLYDELSNQGLFPEVGEVDWDLVEAAGSLGSYYHMKSKSKKIPGKKSKRFYVLPGQYVYLHTRKELEEYNEA